MKTNTITTLILMLLLQVAVKAQTTTVNYTYDAFYANKFNIPVTHVGYYSGLRTEFIPSKWTLSNNNAFMNSGNIVGKSLQYFNKLNSRLLRLK